MNISKLEKMYMTGWKPTLTIGNGFEASLVGDQAWQMQNIFPHFYEWVVYSNPLISFGFSAEAKAAIEVYKNYY